ncbi:sugar ABC transporter ATP-binding protein [Cryobacterium sp. Y11]|uniref:sugar ABC transporter ATP-binding protein n=1 Tax=Cryobacterium sp. Y11 TaxID=2045016 RepID=UPI0018EC76CE|nr:sugar ABC transporter ATP-binding protein [Cryobacterium sp. Y11]
MASLFWATPRWNCVRASRQLRTPSNQTAHLCGEGCLLALPATHFFSQSRIFATVSGRSIMIGKPLLTASNISISFGGVKALRGVDFTIGEGEILCLAGENGCGKSTFTKIISGVYTPDTGAITIGDETVGSLTPRSAIAAGVQVIYQDLSLFGHLSVAENIAVNRMMHDGSKFVRSSAMRDIARQQLERVGVDLDLDVPVSTLSVANKQIVAICRALSMEARLLFMDEPTTALTGREVTRLLSIILDLKARGLSIVFISHKLDEVFKIADSITIFRDGRKVGDFQANELDELSLSRHMTGRDVTYTRYHRTRPESEPLLEISNLSRKGNYSGIDLAVRPGDIVGLTGLLGSGRTEIALTLFGLNKPDGGEIKVNGKPVVLKAPWDAMRHGIALLPEERGSQGLFATQSVEANISVTMLDRILNPMKILNHKTEKALATRVVNEMGVNNKDTSLAVANLSGGNQQKVVLGKWIAREPQIFILDSPTVGIDIGSKSEIYDKIHRLAESGMGVIFISDEPEEIVANCNRVVVMHDGEILERFDESQVRADNFKDELVQIINDPEYRVHQAAGER